MGANVETEALVANIGGVSIENDQAAKYWWEKLYRYAATPTAALALSDTWYKTDVRSVLPAIQVPSLVIARSIREETEYTASKIPGTRVVEILGSDNPCWCADQDRLFLEIGEFLATVDREQAEFDRVLATVLFTDIVGSSTRAAELGADRAWKDSSSSTMPSLELSSADTRAMRSTQPGTASSPPSTDRPELSVARQRSPTPSAESTSRFGRGSTPGRLRPSTTRWEVLPW